MTEVHDRPAPPLFCFVLSSDSNGCDQMKGYETINSPL